jgi:hypothetical protein
MINSPHEKGGVMVHKSLISPLMRNGPEATLFLDSANHIDEATNEDVTNRMSYPAKSDRETNRKFVENSIS